MSANHPGLGRTEGTRICHPQPALDSTHGSTPLDQTPPVKSFAADPYTKEDLQTTLPQIHQNKTQVKRSDIFGLGDDVHIYQTPTNSTEPTEILPSNNTDLPYQTIPSSADNPSSPPTGYSIITNKGGKKQPAHSTGATTHNNNSIPHSSHNTDSVTAIIPPPPEGTLRFLHLNTGGISAKAKFAELKTLLQQIMEFNAAIFSINEHTLDTTQASIRKDVYDINQK